MGIFTTDSGVGQVLPFSLVKKIAMIFCLGSLQKVHWRMIHYTLKVLNTITKRV